MTKYTMDADIRDQWLKDLRSGNFRQGRGTLAKYNKDTRKYEYCCLGVVGHRCGLLERYEDTYVSGFSAYSHTTIKKRVKGTEDEDGFLAISKKDSTARRALKVDGKIFLPLKLQRKLANLNDEGKSFKEIADWIEKNTVGRPVAKTKKVVKLKKAA